MRAGQFGSAGGRRRGARFQELRVGIQHLRISPLLADDQPRPGLRDFAGFHVATL